MKFSAAAIIILFLVLIFSSCSQNSELTYPAAQFITLKNDSALVHLNYKEEVIINNELAVKFEGVAADSRCPINVDCIWAGDGEVKLKATKRDGSISNFILHTDLLPRSVILFDNYMIELKTLLPLPFSPQTIKQEDYSIDIILRIISEKNLLPVQLIDTTGASLIMRDPLKKIK